VTYQVAGPGTPHISKGISSHLTGVNHLCQKTLYYMNITYALA
jgi:hypothetical protein